MWISINVPYFQVGFELKSKTIEFPLLREKKSTSITRVNLRFYQFWKEYSWNWTAHSICGLMASQIRLNNHYSLDLAWPSILSQQLVLLDTLIQPVCHKTDKQIEMCVRSVILFFFSASICICEKNECKHCGSFKTG